MPLFSKHIRTGILTGTISKLRLRNPTVDQEMKYWRALMTDRDLPNVSEGQRALQNIPVFTGEGTVTWNTFEHPWMVAIRNKNLTEMTLRTALVSKLQGTAGVFYMTTDRAHLMDFAEVMEKLRKRYTQDPTSSLNAVASTFQKSKEAVEDFNARMLLAAGGLLPTPPRELAVLQVGASEWTFPNPLLQEQEKEYEAQRDGALRLIVRYFLAGLRPEIREKVTSDVYTDYRQLVEAAIKAERMRQTVLSMGHVHHVRESDDPAEAEANALQAKWKGRKVKVKKGKPEMEQSRATKDTKCFECGKMGHFARDCRSRDPSKRIRVNKKIFQTARQMKNRSGNPAQAHNVAATSDDAYYDPEEEEEYEVEEEEEEENN
jgi:hypothetical protein